MSRVALVLALVFCAGCPAPKATAPASKAAATLTRDEFKAKVMGKTAAEVIAAVGKPDDTSEGAIRTWKYRDRTTDPVTGKTDALAFVYFGDDGRVSRVGY